ncbi:esterase/lipase family protein [Planctomycetota bacterium]
MPSRPPVVIVNGLNAPLLAAKAYGLALQARGFRVFTVGLRRLGWGDLRASARDVAARVDRVRAETGARKVHLVGMSLGGLVGLYYLKCLGGGASVERFVSVGGPLNGSTLARDLTRLLPLAPDLLAQTRPGSDLLRELTAAPPPEGVLLYSVGTRGDPLTPRSAWDASGLEPVETPYGCFPVGHWLLFVHPGNLKVVAELLAAPAEDEGPHARWRPRSEG